MSGVCRHGSLRRVCEICDLEETVKELEAEIERLKHAFATARAKERERWLSWMESTPYPDPPIKDKPWYSQSCFNDGCTAYRNMLRSALRDEEEK